MYDSLCKSKSENSLEYEIEKEYKKAVKAKKAILSFEMFSCFINVLYAI